MSAEQEKQVTDPVTANDSIENKSIVNKSSYYSLNKDKLNQYHECECGGRYSRNTRYNHFKSARHKNAMKVIENKNKQIEEMTNKLNIIKQI